jgi:hypothetical protein
MRQVILIFVLILPVLCFAQDEIIQQGVYNPNFFAELLDVEILNPNVAYILGVGGFVFIDISNINQPSLMGRYDPGSIYKRFYNGIAVGNLAVGAARLDGLYIINISTLSQPTLYNQYQPPGHSYESVDMQADYAYAAVHEKGVEVLYLADPVNPVSITMLNNIENAWDVFIESNYLYIADGRGGLKIYSIANPVNPQFEASIQTSGHAKEVVVENNMAYVALGAGGIDIIDVTNPKNPQMLSNFSTQFGIVNHLAVSNNQLFAATWELVMAIDVTNPQNPLLVATEDTPVRAMGLAVLGNNIYVSDWSRFRTYSFTNQSLPDIHIKPNVFDFGYQGSQVPVNKEFQIHNLGETNLVVSNIAINDPQFTIAPFTQQIQPGSFQVATVTYTPSTPGGTSQLLTFNNNDPDEASKQIPVFGGQSGLAPGSQAPNFTLPDLNGTNHSLSQYQGKTILLAFFASW